MNPSRGIQCNNKFGIKCADWEKNVAKNFLGNFQLNFCSSVLTLQWILKQREELIDGSMNALSYLITHLLFEKTAIQIFFPGAINATGEMERKQARKTKHKAQQRQNEPNLRLEGPGLKHNFN